jgi:hypothetical protein
MTSRALKALCVLGFVGLTTHAEALVVLQQVSVPLGIEFDSNPELSPDDEQSVWRYYTIPTYTISAVENQNRWYSSIGFRIMRSSDKEIVADRDDPVVTLGWDRELEKGFFKLFGSYDKDSIRSTELKRTGIVKVDGDVTAKALNVAWSRLLTEKVNLTLGGRLDETEYETADLIDYKNRAFNSGLTYQINEKTDVFVTADYLKYIPSGNNSDINHQKYFGGANIHVSPSLSVTAGAGWSHFSSFASYMITKAGFDYQLEKHAFRGAIGRTADIAGGDADVVKSDSALVGYSYSIDDRSRFGSELSWAKNEIQIEQTTNRIINFSNFYERDISQRWLMRLSLGLKRLKEEDQSAAKGETAGISFTYVTPQF